MRAGAGSLKLPDRPVGTLAHTHTPVHAHTPQHTPVHAQTHTYRLPDCACVHPTEARTALSCVHTRTDLCKRAQGVCTRLFPPYGLVHNCSLYIPVCAHPSWPYPPANIFTYPYTHTCARPTHAHPRACTCAPTEYLLCLHTHARYPAPHTLTPVPLCPFGDTQLSPEASRPCPTPRGGGSARSRDFPGRWDEDVYY